MDFRVITDNSRYGVRVTAIIVKDNKLLTYKVKNQNHLVGGAIEVGESSYNAVFREVKEELGVECLVKDLMFVVENRFYYYDELHHMIEFHYKVELLESPPSYTVDENSFECEWLSIENLSNYDLRPKFIKKELQKWNGTVKHINIDLEKE